MKNTLGGRFYFFQARRGGPTKVTTTNLVTNLVTGMTYTHCYEIFVKDLGSKICGQTKICGQRFVVKICGQTSSVSEIDFLEPIIDDLQTMS